MKTIKLNFDSGDQSPLSLNLEPRATSYSLSFSDTGGTNSSLPGIKSYKDKLINNKLVDTSGVDYTYSTNASWITIRRESRTGAPAYTDYLVITVSANSGSSSRSASINITQKESGRTLMVNINQSANIPITYTYDLMCIPENGDDRTEWLPNGNAMVYFIAPGSQILKVEGVKIGWKGQNKYNDMYMELITSSMQNHTGSDINVTYQPSYQYLNITVPNRYSGYYYGTITMFGQIRENYQYINQTFVFYQR